MYGHWTLTIATLARFITLAWLVLLGCHFQQFPSGRCDLLLETYSSRLLMEECCLHGLNCDACLLGIDSHLGLGGRVRNSW